MGRVNATLNSAEGDHTEPESVDLTFDVGEKPRHETEAEDQQ